MPALSCALVAAFEVRFHELAQILFADADQSATRQADNTQIPSRGLLPEPSFTDAKPLRRLG
ncbi:MAG: hypothetical protein WBU92_01455 [Candidatus Dormiibacterota bacterium]